MELTLAKSDVEVPQTASDVWGQYRVEVDTYYKTVKLLHEMEPLEVFRLLSAFSARASEMRTKLSRVDSPRAKVFRTQEIEPLIEELDRQFKIHSRILSIREFEFKTGGERGLT